jgi:hypothetical protein
MARLLSGFWQEARRRVGRCSDRSADLIAAPKRFLDELACGGFKGSELGKMFGDA